MSLPALSILWRCATAGLELTAAHHWAEVRQLAAPHQVDIDRALEPSPALPDGENFLSHPFLQACLLQKPESYELISQYAASLTLGQSMRENLPSLAKGNPLRLEPVLASIEPEDLPPGRAGKSTAEILLRYTGTLDIPWDELTALAATAPQSRLPPPGSIPPMDDFTSPLVTMASPENLVDLIQLAELRFHCLLAMKKPEEARQCLLVQSRIVSAWLRDSTLVGVMIGATVTDKIVSQIQAGFSSGLWKAPDIAWFAAWAAPIDLRKTLSTAIRNECRQMIRGIEGTKCDPGIPARMARHFRQDLLLASFFSDEDVEKMALRASLPFDCKIFEGWNDFTGMIYTLAPDAAFTLWKAAEASEFCTHHLPLLRDGGLAAYAWPDEETREDISPPITYAQIGSITVTAQTQLNLLRCACALEQWCAAKGEYPQELTVLTSAPAKATASDSTGPSAALPASALEDVCSGKPLRYQRLSKTNYRLYSLGPDRQDNGGKPTTEGKVDLVWK